MSNEKCQTIYVKWSYSFIKWSYSFIWKPLLAAACLLPTATEHRLLTTDKPNDPKHESLGRGTIGAVGQWASDGRSFLHLVSRNNITNVWSQPIDGGPPKQVTDFKDSLMTGFSWSRDGKHLVCTRGVLMRDAVLISEAGQVQ